VKYPGWFLMSIAAIIAITWVTYALIIDHQSPASHEDFLLISGIFSLVVTALFGAGYIRRKNGKGEP
jgi:drug/metabolite transporter (DMT)-like permease